MRPQEITRLLRRTPFEPFAVHLSDGSRYPVRHPERIIVTPRAAYVGVRVNGKDAIAQDVVICDMVHITRLAPIARRNTKRQAS